MTRRPLTTAMRAMPVLAMPAIKESFKERGVTVVTATPDQFGQFIRSEVAEWTQVVKDAGVKID